MNKYCRIAIVLSVTLLPGSLLAQEGIGVAGHIGTLGIGVDVAVAASPMIGLRAGANVMPLEIDAAFSDVDFTLELQSPQFMALVDLYPAGGFRLSGGFRYSSSNIVLTGDVTQTVDLDGTDYSLDSLVGTIGTSDLAPYVGIGFGNPAEKRVGFFLDLGVAYQGKPELGLEAFGNATTQPGFNSDLEAERIEVEDELKKYFRFYPVISVGFSIGF